MPPGERMPIASANRKRKSIVRRTPRKKRAKTKVFCPLGFAKTPGFSPVVRRFDRADFGSMVTGNSRFRLEWLFMASYYHRGSGFSNSPFLVFASLFASRRFSLRVAFRFAPLFVSRRFSLRAASRRHIGDGCSCTPRMSVIADARNEPRNFTNCSNNFCYNGFGRYEW